MQEPIATEKQPLLPLHYKDVFVLLAYAIQHVKRAYQIIGRGMNATMQNKTAQTFREGYAFLEQIFPIQ